MSACALVQVRHGMAVSSRDSGPAGVEAGSELPSHEAHDKTTIASDIKPPPGYCGSRLLFFCAMVMEKRDNGSVTVVGQWS
jgi:hypothetical protein